MLGRVAIIKTGWSDDYRGGVVVGDFKFIEDYREGHERFNFLAGPDGRYHGYLPPIGPHGALPIPEHRDGWLLVFVSKRVGKPGLYIVGWYEDARFEASYRSRPEYQTDPSFPHDAFGNEYIYAITAPRAVLIPEALRTYKLPTNRLKSTPIAYLAGNGNADLWRTELAAAVRQQITLFDALIPDDEGAPPPTGSDAAMADPLHIKAVEVAAIQAVEARLDELGYQVFDRQKDNCGYDLLGRHKESGDELHVEVKGTSGATKQFFMSRNEYRYMDQPQWRLGMVTAALTAPAVEVLDKNQVMAIFDLEEFTWQARAK